jgi:hypothetical protein
VELKIGPAHAANEPHEIDPVFGPSREYPSRPRLGVAIFRDVTLADWEP